MTEKKKTVKEEKAKVVAKEPKKAVKPKAESKPKKAKPEEKPKEEVKKAEVSEEPKVSEEKVEEKKDGETKALEEKKEETKVEEKKEEKKKVKERKPKPVEKIKYVAEEKIERTKTKPRFARQEFPKLKRLSDCWRRPQGIDSKRLEGKRGKGALPSIGYGSPKKELGLHPSGLMPVRVSNMADLSSLKAGVNGAVIASQVGRRKRNMIIKEANKLRIVVLNPRKGEV